MNLVAYEHEQVLNWMGTSATTITIQVSQYGIMGARNSKLTQTGTSVSSHMTIKGKLASSGEQRMET